jgi:hemerythrin
LIRLPFGTTVPVSQNRPRNPAGYHATETGGRADSKEISPMTKLEWTDKLSIGIELVDLQHKQWIAHFNGAVDAIEAHLGKDHIIRDLGFLVDYTGKHFATEEKHMAATNYPGMAEHKAMHAELCATLDDLVRDFEEEGANEPLAHAVETFLGNWLITHIQNVDMKFGAFLKANSIQLSDDAE